MKRRLTYALAAAAVALGLAAGAIGGSAGPTLAVSGGELIIELTKCSNCG
jgi:hypothetical protein